MKQERWAHQKALENNSLKCCDVKEMKIFRCMQGTLVKNPFPIQWKIHFPVPYETRRLRALSQCTHRSNSLEETILYSDTKKTNWNHTEGRRHCTCYVCDAVGSSHGVKGLWWCWASLGKAGGEQRGQGGAQNLPCSLPAAEPFSSTPPLLHTKCEHSGIKGMAKAQWFLSLFKKELLLSRE